MAVVTGDLTLVEAEETDLEAMHWRTNIPARHGRRVCVCCSEFSVGTLYVHLSRAKIEMLPLDLCGKHLGEVRMVSGDALLQTLR